MHLVGGLFMTPIISIKRFEKRAEKAIENFRNMACLEGWRTNCRQHSILGMPQMKTVRILVQCNKVHNEKSDEENVSEKFISGIDSSINVLSARFSQFKEFLEALKFIVYPDVTSFDKLNLSQFNCLGIEVN
ncbi:uncharacterized protein TNCV_2720821 [Trichonephila clavipes]|nr:uncharacterized protein TNCV_2720821 [Trichonephila clavipes]